MRSFHFIAAAALASILGGFGATLAAQDLTDAQKAAAAAAAALQQAQETATETKKPSLWTNSLKSTINFGQTTLTNWAAGGDNTYSLAAYIDGNANWKKDEMYWNNRLQLDYGFIYASSKPILQKNTDKIYLESKWGYQIKNKLYFSANFDYRSQFSKGWNYKTPSSLTDDMTHKQEVQAWKDARVLKSSLLSPAYTNIGLGIEWKASKWLNVNLAPATAGLVIINEPTLRSAYSMPISGKYETLDPASEEYADLKNSGMLYKGARFELGAQVKIDIKLNINDNFTYSTQFVGFTNYLNKPFVHNRINWDNRFGWKLAKYFSLDIITNLIYDPEVLIINEKDIDKYPSGVQRIQLKENIAFGFTYLITSKK